MKLLAIDTSTSIAGVSILENNKVLAELNINNEKTHSQKLLPMINNILDEFELKVSDFDIFSVVTGPGSFTGLRIGITTIKTFAYLFNKPVVGVPTLDVLAYNYQYSDKLICPIIDARNCQVYTSVFEYDRCLKRITDYVGVHIDELVDKLKGYDKEVLFLGDGVDNNLDYLKEKLGDKAYFACENLKYQKASSLAVLSYELYLSGTYEDAFSIKPFYLRQSQAERLRDKKNKND